MGPEMNPSLPSSLLLFKNNLDVIKIISNQWREKLHKNNIFNFKNLTRERVPNKTLPPPKENITCFITLPRDKWPLTFLFCKTSYRAGHWRSHVYDSSIIHYSSQIKYTENCLDPDYLVFIVELKRGLSESDDEEYFESRGSVSNDFIIFDNFGS